VGSGAVVKLDRSGLVAGRNTVTGHVNDGQSGSADCSVDIDARAPVPTALELNPDGGRLTSREQTLITLVTDFETYLQTRRPSDS
jgi:hypothetical protein